MLLLALTGHGRSKAYERSYAAGCDHRFVKPLDPYELARLLGEGTTRFASQ
jgi:hypothetical protein